MGAPVFIQTLNSDITFLQPFVPGRNRSRAKILCDMTLQFIIDLPSNERRMIAQILGQRLHYTEAGFAHCRMLITHMLTRTVN